MRSRSFIWVFVIINLLLDLYVFQVVKSLATGAGDKTKMVIYIMYWSLSMMVAGLILLMPYINFDAWSHSARSYIVVIIGGLFLAKLIAGLFFFADDLRRGSMWLMAQVWPSKQASFTKDGELLSRSAFLNWMGLGLGTTLFGTLVYGFSNKYNYKVRRVNLAFNNLPKSFKGFKIVQLSDIHSGSFTNKQAVEHGVQMVLNEKPDIILFTGDLVNDRASEMYEYVEVFNKLSAPHGVFSTLGNHDYGDYVQWETPDAQKANLEELKSLQSKMGWRLLMNEHVPIERNGEEIALLGIENWSAKARFPKHGRLDLAHAGTEKYPFKILMSHDPSHWDAQVRDQYSDIDLMLSGHTHGMQFGIENPYFKWSPVKWMYTQWAGLYQQKNQKLYVNRGYGFIGYPGRVGILPEISVITLA